MLTLGLDIGTNSIGWAVVNAEINNIIGSGVRIFQAGIENIGQGEKEISRNAQRRDNRLKRRQYFRRRLRKRILLNLLHQLKMAPDDFKALKDGSQEEAFRQWFSQNPYSLRAKAVSEKINLQQLGRVFYHLAQHRGFQSNSRRAISAEDKGSKIFDSTGDKPGIFATRAKLKSHTLGSYLSTLYPAEGQPFSPATERIRNRYTTRQIYIDEFEAIWARQSQYYPDLLTPALKETIGGRKNKLIGAENESAGKYKNDGILFFQRPLKSQRQKLGKCTFEKNKNRCPKSHYSFEEFRLRQFLNGIKVDGRSLTEQELEKAWLWGRKKKVDPKFNALRKHLKLQDDYFQFNYPDDQRIPACPTIAKLSNKLVFGDGWFSLPEKEKQDRWHIIYNAKDVDWLGQYAIKRWSKDEKSAKYIAEKVHLADGYGNLSLKAINNILPFLRKGFTYDAAVALAGVRNAFGADNWLALGHDVRDSIVAEVFRLIRQNRAGGFMDELKAFLENHFELPQNWQKKLYHHSLTKFADGQLDRLLVNSDANRAINNIRNPIVITALYETRRLVNTLLEKFGPFDQIHLELGKEVKGNKQQRKRIAAANKNRDENRRKVVEALEKANVPVNYENILKYRLWLECEQTSPYTGNKINFDQLFDGSIEIEHIHPWSRSLNDSWTNKTLCETSINREKTNRTPYEYFSSLGQWDKAKDIALRIFKTSKEFPGRYAKFEQFAKENFDDDFVSRQMNDMRYASQEARKLLSQVCKTVRVFPGALTGELRQQWGLNTLINDDNIAKNRTDHRHHAIDAIVIALATTKNFQQLARFQKYGQRNERRTQVDEPWDGFRGDAQRSIDSILVSHRKSNRAITKRMVKTVKKGNTYLNKGVAARGLLHKETVYGKRKDPATGMETFRVRKSLDLFKNIKQLNKIADQSLLKHIKNYLTEKHGIDVENEETTIPKDAFFYKDEQGKTHTHISLPNRRGKVVPVFKARVKEKGSNMKPLKEDVNQFVDPRSNHHVLLYLDENEKMKEQVVSFWEAVERAKNGDPVIQMPPEAKTFVASLEINDMFLIGLEEEDWESLSPTYLSDKLYRVQKLSSGDYGFRHHLAAKQDIGSQEIRISSTRKWQQLKPVKVRIGIDGSIFASNM